MIQAESKKLNYPQQPVFFTCRICGETKDNLNGYDRNSDIFQIMEKYQVCYHCAYWINLTENRPIGYEVIGGVMYDVHPYVCQPLQKIKASEGKEFYIYRHDGSLVRTNNLWNLGQIPLHFLPKHPDTAKFVTLGAYIKLTKDNHVCNAKGCWDRYHCFRYNSDNEKMGAFNDIPKSHKIGDEKCPSFINKNDFKFK